MPEKIDKNVKRKIAYFDPLKDISWCHLLRYIKIKYIFRNPKT